MRNLPPKLALTGGVAAFLVALPGSIGVSRSKATASGHAGAIRVGLQCDTSQAVVGRPGTPRDVLRATPTTLPGAVRRHY